MLLPFLILAVKEAVSILCYNCTTAIDPNCETIPRSTQWIECKGECQVWKLYSEADSKTYMFERYCNEYCHQGCTHLADMEHRFVGCSSCCSFDFCNVGNPSPTVFSSLVLFYSLLLSL